VGTKIHAEHQVTWGSPQLNAFFTLKIKIYSVHSFFPKASGLLQCT